MLPLKFAPARQQVARGDLQGRVPSQRSGEIGQGQGMVEELFAHNRRDGCGRSLGPLHRVRAVGGRSQDPIGDIKALLGRVAIFGLRDLLRPSTQQPAEGVPADIRRPASLTQSQVYSPKSEMNPAKEPVKVSLVDGIGTD